MTYRSSTTIAATSKKFLVSHLKPYPNSYALCINWLLAREDYLELRQEASELHEYSNAKLERVTCYLGALAEKTQKLDQFAHETEARLFLLINEKGRLFNDIDNQRYSSSVS